jgi:alkyl hydroperoxide reductase subunit AhpC
MALTAGRNFDEIIRAIDPMQLVAKQRVATSATESGATTSSSWAGRRPNSIFASLRSPELTKSTGV